MGNRILITYASKYGSTGEVAEYVGQVMRDLGGMHSCGMPVDVLSVKDVKALSAYHSVVIGSAARMDRVLSEAVAFAKAHQDDLRRMTTAYFVVGTTMKRDTPENREKARTSMKALCQVKEPVCLGLFAGKLDYSKIGLLWRTIAKQDKTGLMAEGDFRDWARIQDWTRDLASVLIPGLRVQHPASET